MTAGPGLKPPNLQDVAPELVAELEELLSRKGEQALAGKVAKLAIIDRCRCEDDFCGSFYTAPRRTGSFGRCDYTIALEPVLGLLLVDVVGSNIGYVEVLFWPDLQRRSVKRCRDTALQIKSSAEMARRGCPAFNRSALLVARGSSPPPSEPNVAFQGSLQQLALALTKHFGGPAGYEALNQKSIAQPEDGAVLVVLPHAVEHHGDRPTRTRRKLAPVRL